MYFTDHKLPIEIDEKWHKDRKEEQYNEIEKAIEKELDCKLVNCKIN